MATAEGPVAKGPVFQNCSFAVVRSAELSDKDAKKIAETVRLHSGEATIDSYPEANLDLDVSHIITTSTDFPDYYTAVDRFIHVVKPQWVDSSLALGRLAHPRRYSPDPRLIMSEIVATCAELPEGDEEAIAGGILAMGGNYSTKVTTQTTHIFTLTMEAEKVQHAASKKLPVKFVLPHWIDDCLKLGKKISEDPYTLPDPELFATPGDRAPGSKTNRHVRDASHPDPQDGLPNGPRMTEHTPRKVFKGKRIVLDDDLGISVYLRGILDKIVTSSGGKIVTAVTQADAVVCKYRRGKNYQIASKAGKDVGNLAWLYYLIVYDTWTSPLRRLLHYPVAEKGLPGFEHLKISLSNYSGEARTYLENLVIATGAECTKTLRQENTHLITAHTQSEKVAAARDWNVHVLNHLWLEESYAKWEMQSMTNSRYTHFPLKSNLGDIVGQTQIDRDVIAKLFISDRVDTTESPVPAPAPASAELKDSTSGKASKKSKTQGPDPSTVKVNANQASEAVENGKPSKLNTPAPARTAAFGKEDDTPGTTRSRKSKDAAAAKLQDMSTDIALYEKEKKRAGGVVYGGRRRTEDDHNQLTRKRSIDEALEAEGTEEREAKKSRGESTAIEIHLLISGYKRWIGKSRQEDSDMKKLRELGITVVTHPSKASHLAVPHVVRTVKFIVALAHAPTVISTDFVDSCLDEGICPDPNDFILKDESDIQKLGVTLAVAQRRAKENSQQLLAGRSIYCVEKIHGGVDTYQAIVEANGGTFMTFHGRQNTIPSRRATSEAKQQEDSEAEVYLISTDSKEDRKLWSRFVKMAENSRHVPRIVRSNWLLDSALQQKVLPTKEHNLS